MDIAYQRGNMPMIWRNGKYRWRYGIELERYKKNKSLIDSTIIEFIKEQAGISIVPEQYRENLWNKAWEDGHSGGFYEVYLSSLIEIFE